MTCGDSQCEKRYHFIGLGTGKGRGPEGKKITYAEAWEGFRRSLTSARIPCTAIPRYPVVARWRADVDYVAAGIYCFQPYWSDAGAVHSSICRGRAARRRLSD